MGLLTRLRAPASGATSPVVVAKDAPDLSSASGLNSSAWNQGLNRPGMAQLRTWSRNNEWVRAAIRHRREQVSSAKWIIEPIDPDKSYDAKLQQFLEELFAFPNPHRDSFRTLIEPVVEDWLVIGWGALEKDQNVRRQPVALYHVDASRLEFAKGWTGLNPNLPRYFFKVDSAKKIPLRNDQLLVVLADPATDREEGLSTLEVLRNTIQAELAGASWARDHMKHQPPNGLLHLGEGAGDQQVSKFREMWNSEIAGQSSIAITGGTKDPKYLQFHSQSGADLLQWELYFTRKLCAVFRISPQDLGITFDINRATAMTQADITRDSGLVPLLLLIEEYLNREIVWDYGQPNQLNLRFSFTQLNETDRAATSTLVNLQNGAVPRITLNEARKEEGREPLDGGNVIMVLTPNGPMAMLGEGVPTPSEVAQSMLDSQRAQIEATHAKATAAAQPTPDAPEAAGADAAQQPAQRKRLDGKAEYDPLERVKTDAAVAAEQATAAHERDVLADYRASYRALALALTSQAETRRDTIREYAGRRLEIARNVSGRERPHEARDAYVWAVRAVVGKTREAQVTAYFDAWLSIGQPATQRLARTTILNGNAKGRLDAQRQAAQRAVARLNGLETRALEWLATQTTDDEDALGDGIDDLLLAHDDDTAVTTARDECIAALLWAQREFMRRNALTGEVKTPAGWAQIGKLLDAGVPIDGECEFYQFAFDVETLWTL